MDMQDSTNSPEPKLLLGLSLAGRDFCRQHPLPVLVLISMCSRDTVRLNDLKTLCLLGVLTVDDKVNAELAPFLYCGQSILPNWYRRNALYNSPSDFLLSFFRSLPG